MAWIKEPGNDWFQPNLWLKDASGGSVSVGFKGASLGFSFPGIGLNKSTQPGAGFCCVFDHEGNIKKSKGVINGNNECWADVNVMKKAANDAGTANPNTNWVGVLYWCVGPQANCHMDWWAYEFNK